jgi:hypothetical protein
VSRLVAERARFIAIDQGFRMSESIKMSEVLKSDYESYGYSLIRAAATPDVTNHFLAIICAQLNAKPEKFLTNPQVNTKPAYEFYSYHHPATMGFHWGLTSRMVELTGKRLAPTYAYFRAYQKGDTCTVHSDRQSCEHSLSMQLGNSDGIVWPFEIGETRYDFEAACKLQKAHDFGAEPARQLTLDAGDAILYQGCNYRHGRTTPNPNRWSAHLFLHWVDLDGPFKEWSFDGQKFPPAGNFLFPAKITQ